MLIPIVVLGAVSFLNRGFAQNLISPPGLWVLIYSAISFTAGFLIINKIVNLTEGPNK
jgi:Flp pilus assembly protein TadB